MYDITALGEILIDFTYQGIGVFTVDGKMIDIAFYDGAKRTLAMAKAAGVYKGDL